MIRTSSYIILCLCLSCFKLLFLKSYVSTDFDVHRNWMSITYNLPIKDWYFDTTSEWTLDYPPLFAVFELLLAFFSQLFHIQDALVLTGQPIRSNSVIVYQKITVILSDLVYFYGVYKLCNSLEPLLRGTATEQNKSTLAKQTGSTAAPTKNDPPPSTLKEDSQHEDKKSPQTETKQQVRKQSPSPTPPIAQQNKLSIADAFYRPDATSCISIFLLLQPDLLIVDHIHFQYNGLLSGILLISAAATIDGRYMAAAFWFAVLLNMKHIYLYCAPAYGMYLLVAYCLAKRNGRSRIMTLLMRAGRLGSIVISVFLITYAPFANQATLQQIVARLFPFKRGLTHAYWAPNVWSLYNLADKVLATVYKDSIRIPFNLESISKTKHVTSTSGLVQEYEHMYLPSVKPMTTFILVGLFMFPIVIKFLFRIDRRSPRLYLKALTLSAFTSFMFGWHVHEKAILMILLPVTPLCFTDQNLRSPYLRLTLAGTYSLFPLVFKPAEYPIKLCLLIAFYTFACSQSLAICSRGDKRRKNNKKNNSQKFMETSDSLAGKLYALLDKAYVVTLILNEIYIILVFGRLNHSWNPLAKLNKFEFLPLMMTSTLTALGITSSYLELYYDFVVSADELVSP